MKNRKEIQLKETCSSVDKKFTNLLVTAYEILGIPGRMLSRSKNMRKPTTICNANVFNANAEKIWFGDIEIERDQEALIQLAATEGTLYILYETDGRFLDQIPSPDYVRSVAAFIVENGGIRYSDQFEKYVKFRQSLGTGRKCL